MAQRLLCGLVINILYDDILIYLNILVLAYYLLVRDTWPFLLNMPEIRPRKSRLLPAALISESEP